MSGVVAYPPASERASEYCSDYCHPVTLCEHAYTVYGVSYREGCARVCVCLGTHAVG